MKNKLVIVIAVLLFFISCKQPENQLQKASTLPQYTLLIGTDGNMENAGAITTDGKNLYISGNNNNNVFFAKVSPTGKIYWAKQWVAPISSKAFNSFHNNKLGGSAASLKYDGNAIYAIFNSLENQDDIYSVIIAKIDPADGKLIWIKNWRHDFPDENVTISTAFNDIAYGMEVIGNYIFVTGTSGRSKAFLLALDKTTGELIFQKLFELNRLKRDRAFVTKVNEKNELYISGLSGNTPFLIMVNNPTSSNPSIAWAKKITLPYSARINDIDFDAQNNIYLSFFIDGASTKYMIGKLSFNYDVLWTKIFPSAVSADNRSYFIKYHNGYIYTTGSITPVGTSPKQHDGVIFKLNAQDGSIDKSLIFRTPPKNEATADHIAKAVVILDNDIYIFGQACGSVTNASNFDLEYYTQNLKSRSAEFKLDAWFQPVKFEDVPNGGIINAQGSYTDYLMNAQKPDKKVATSTPDCDLFLSKLTDF